MRANWLSRRWTTIKMPKSAVKQVKWHLGCDLLLTRDFHSDDIILSGFVKKLRAKERERIRDRMAGTSLPTILLIFSFFSPYFLSYAPHLTSPGLTTTRLQSTLSPNPPRATNKRASGIANIMKSNFGSSSPRTLYRQIGFESHEYSLRYSTLNQTALNWTELSQSPSSAACLENNSVFARF